MSVFLASLMAFPVLADPPKDDPPCAIQDYDSDKAPNFECKSPEEDAVVHPDVYKPSAGLKEGEKAPWAGVLLEKGKVIELGMRVQSLRRLRWIDRKDGRRTLATELNYQQSVAGAQKNLFEQQVRDLKGQNAAQAKRISGLESWYRSPALWLALGVLVAGATFGVAFGVNAK